MGTIGDSYPTWTWIGSLIVSLAFAWVCGALARGKGRSVPLWAILGFFFSCITLVVILVLPRRTPQY